MAEERPTISIEDGSIRGMFRLSYHGRKYVAFEGIPYAQPPIKELRFKVSTIEGYGAETGQTVQNIQKSVQKFYAFI